VLSDKLALRRPAMVDVRGYVILQNPALAKKAGNNSR